LSTENYYTYYITITLDTVVKNSVTGTIEFAWMVIIDSIVGLHENLEILPSH